MRSFLLLPFTLALTEAAQKPIGNDWVVPRGLNPSLSDKYRPDNDNQFTCISTPHIKIHANLVNDDFCDCPDGSDEPGTSACSHLNHSVNPLPGFYCANKGHIPSYIPFSRINDGICDYDLCCDGSDEWMGMGGVKCPDNCDSIGREARKAAEEARRLYESGLKNYKSLVERAGLLRKEAEDKVAVLTGEISRMEIEVEKKRIALREAEEEEKLKVSTDSTGEGKHAGLLKLAKERIEEYKETLNTLQTQKEALEYQLESAEKILSTFKEEYNPNFNDEGVKRAVKAWEDYLAMKPTKDENENDFKADVQTLATEEINWDEWEPEPIPFVEDMYAIESLLPPFLRSWVHSQLNSLRDTLVENGLLAHRKTTPSTSQGGSTHTSPRIQKLTDDLSRVEGDLSTKKSQLDGLNSDLTKDYGTNSVFWSLKDICTEAESGEYTYSYCHMARASQKNRDGGSTHLGDWSGFERRLDEEIEEEVLVVKFERGARCWNGPERSAYVYLRCGPEEKLLTVAETEKCVYKMVAVSPAVCSGEGGGEVKTEKVEEWGS
ncbi:hypothetical protein AA313_de0200514 [Arthrobotrys entomopaga]|nr:hypothetical protein AA313_de0200514 [Arthrobotrys entomopaga]